PEPAPFLAGADFPQADGAVEAAREQTLPVGQEGEGGDAFRMPSQSLYQLPVGCIPQRDRSVSTPDGKMLAVGRKQDTMDKVASLAGAGDGPDRCPRCHAPDAYHAAPAAGGQQLAVRREGHRIDGGPVASQAAEFLAAGHVPQADVVVLASRGQEPAV